MKHRLIAIGMVIVFGLLTGQNIYSQSSSPLTPVDQGSWIIAGTVGPAYLCFRKRDRFRNRDQILL